MFYPFRFERTGTWNAERWEVGLRKSGMISLAFYQDNQIIWIVLESLETQA